MKKILNKMLVILPLLMVAVAVVIVGCNRKVEVPETQTQITVDVAVNDTYNAAQNAPTKVSASGFVDGDKISFFAVKYSEATPNQLGLDAATYLNNVLYQRDNGFFKHYDGTQYIRDFFPNDGSSIDIYGLYPRDAAITDFVSYPFVVKADQKAAADYYLSDLMMAKTAAIAPQAIPNKLLFHHLLAKVEINVKLLNFATGSSIKEVRLINIIPDVKVNLRAFDGTSTRVDVGTKSPIKIFPLEVAPTDTGFVNTYTAVVPAQLLTSNTAVVEVVLNTVNNDVYTLKLSENFSLQAGKKNVFDITVNFGSRPDIIIDTGKIVAWNETAVNGGTVDKESDYKFKVVLLNQKNTPANTKSVKVGVNGNRTFHLINHTQYVANSEIDNLPAILFEFAGDGNRPGEAGSGAKFSLTRLDLIDAAGTKFNTCDIIPSIEVLKMGEMTLYYDMQAGTISTVKP